MVPRLAILSLMLALAIPSAGAGSTATSASTNHRSAAPVENKKPPKRVRQFCLDAERAIVFYRSRTWEHQQQLAETPLPTYHPERRKNACDYKRWVAKRWQTRAKNKREHLHRVLASPYLYARLVVYSTFPASTAAAALSVVGCETGETYDESAHNTSTDVRGYFQVDTGNVGRVLYWSGHGSIVLQNNNRNSLWDPWYNTKVAAYLSKGGTDWHEWHCQPFIGTG